MIRYAISLFILIGLTACSSQRPVLYPNAHYDTVGRATAEIAIDDCIAMANNSGANSDKTKEIAKNTAEGTIIGGATGAATGAVFGRAATGAGAGAAGGAAAGLTKSIFDADQPEQVYMRFVNKCLADKGFEPIGWN